MSLKRVRAKDFVASFDIFLHFLPCFDIFLISPEKQKCNPVAPLNFVSLFLTFRHKGIINSGVEYRKGI